ncbi:MAG: hypothetical protein KDD60_07965 [Bdellovibrionales bacterium]|nr:hypothetical protein [Bdellovibrionales bacterium]
MTSRLSLSFSSLRTYLSLRTCLENTGLQICGLLFVALLVSACSDHPRNDTSSVSPTEVKVPDEVMDPNDPFRGIGPDQDQPQNYGNGPYGNDPNGAEQTEGSSGEVVPSSLELTLPAKEREQFAATLNRDEQAKLALREYEQLTPQLQRSREQERLDDETLVGSLTSGKLSVRLDAAGKPIVGYRFQEKSEAAKIADARERVRLGLDNDNNH